jgi:hypothetical protein
MNLFKSKQHQDAVHRVNERLAALIAGRVVRFQYMIAAAMNRWFNAYSVRQKKWILFSFGLLVSTVLITGVCSSFYTIPLQAAQNYSSAHIGQPSKIPHQKINNNQLTDSLTIKSRSWKQQQ